jgi:hypothetical protein
MALLSDLRFIEAKVQVRLVTELVLDYQMAFAALPECKRSSG